MSSDESGGDSEALTEAEVRRVVEDVLDEQRPSSTRRNILKALGVGGAAAAMGGTAGAASSSTTGASLDVGSVTANTYRIAGNRYGGPASARSELASELGSGDAGARFAADDTGGEYYWDGSAWQLLPINADEASVTSQLHGPILDALVVGDMHWASDGYGNRFTSQSDLKSRLDEIIDYGNNNNVDVAVFIGDVLDGVDGPGAQKTNSEIVSNANDVTDYIENTGGSSGSGLNCAVEYVMGNHEQVHGDSISELKQVYSAFGYSDLASTWRMPTYKGVNLAILNTSYTTTDYNTNPDDHKIPDSSDPADQLQWMRDNLRTADRPVFAFMHNPVSFDQSGSPYQNTQNQETAAKILNDSSSVALNIFGHVHNHNHWRSIKEDTDGYGNKHLHTGYVYDLDGDQSVTPYGHLRIFGGTGLWQFSASYTKEQTGYQSTWRGNGAEMRQPTPAQQAFERSDYQNDFRKLYSFPADHNELRSISGNLSSSDNYSYVYTAASSGASAEAENRTKSPYWDTRWYGTRGFRSRITLNSTSNITAYAVLGQQTAGRHVGFKFQGGSVYGTVGDGSTQATTSELTTHNGTVNVSAMVIPGERAEFWAGTDGYGELTTNIPPADESTSYGEKIQQVYVETSDSNYKQLEFANWDFFVSRKQMRLDLSR